MGGENKPVSFSPELFGRAKEHADKLKYSVRQFVELCVEQTIAMHQQEKGKRKVPEVVALLDTIVQQRELIPENQPSSGLIASAPSQVKPAVQVAMKKHTQPKTPPNPGK